MLCAGPWGEAKMRRPARMLATWIGLGCLWGCGTTGGQGDDSSSFSDSGRDGPADDVREVPPSDLRDATPEEARDLATGDLGDAPGDLAEDAPGSPDAQDSGTGDGENLDEGPWVRPPVGDPVPSEELANVTDLYLNLMERLGWFDLLDERIHGYPDDLVPGRPGYGTWWSGVRILKENGQVRYLHSADGADNNGLRTAPMLAAMAFALAIRDDPAWVRLTGRIVRGFQSWIRAMERASAPDAPVLMTRASYPESVSWTIRGTEVLIDYSLNRPGLDNGACQYVHLPDNPWWGDLWVKNKRSKDDIGHLLLAIALADPLLRNHPDLRADWEETMDLYGRWARQVEDDGWRIGTWDRDLHLWYPEDDLAWYLMDINGIDPECTIALATRLMGRGDEGTLDCGTGITFLDDAISMKPSNGQMLRSYHEAAIAQARLRQRDGILPPLIQGLARRLDAIFDPPPDGSGPPRPSDEDLAELVIMAGAVGVPLTWREVRFFHDRVRQAHGAYLRPENLAILHPLEPDAPDGTYPFDPPGGGIAFRYLGAALGACVSPWRDPGSMPLLDCNRLREAFFAMPMYHGVLQ